MGFDRVQYKFIGNSKIRKKLLKSSKVSLCFTRKNSIVFAHQIWYFQEFEGLSRFPRKNVLYSPTKFGILKPWANIQSLRSFDLGFWQISKQIYRKRQYGEKVFTKPQALPCFPTKMILYSPTKFGILKPSTNTW